ncbi:MAG: SDR family oxidoreductase, partial [Caldilinea sp.]|nr:SDR family oxidoreductase [Caldilinea sp.]
MSILDRFRLDGRVALVTGGTKGLGLSMAQAFAEAGASVIVASRHGEEAGAVAGELAARGGTRCAGYAVNVTDLAQVESLVGKVLGDFGQVDILVNNAGINIRGPIEELTLESFEVVQAVNVRGPWLLCRALAPHFKARGYGRVINVGSMLSVIGMADRTPYATSKGALLQMTRVLALEWAPHGVTVNAILPGYATSEMTEPLMGNDKFVAAVKPRIPMRRFGEPADYG